jgi:prepilin-type N-terminal cleavage/methylation domain-containing protein
MDRSPHKHVQNYPNRFSHQPFRKHGFTLIELLVAMVIISIVTGLSLSGLAGARQRAKIDKTKSTIRKLHEIVMPHYESYATRRVLASGTGRVRAQSRLTAVRRLMVDEMPDSWIDVSSSTGSTAVSRSIQAKYRSLVNQGNTCKFNQIRTGKTDANATYGNLYANAETMYAFVTLGAFSEDSLEAFRTDEIGDIDGDTAPEFLDAWNRPIMFIRWPAAFRSPFQTGDPVAQPDPLDPLLVSGVNPTTGPHDWLVIPLIYSGGPDGAAIDPLGDDDGYGISASGEYPPSASLITICYGNPQGRISDSVTRADNITNHDLNSK